MKSSVSVGATGTRPGVRREPVLPRGQSLAPAVLPALPEHPGHGGQEGAEAVRKRCAAVPGAWLDGLGSNLPTAKMDGFRFDWVGRCQSDLAFLEVVGLFRFYWDYLSFTDR